MRIDWACAPFAVRLRPQVLRLTTMRVLFGGIVGGLDVRTVEEHKEVVPIARAPAQRGIRPPDIALRV